MHSHLCNYLCKLTRSKDHPVYTNFPQTASASRKWNRDSLFFDGEPGRSHNSSRIEIIVIINIKTILELCAQVKSEINDGKRDVANFIMRKTELKLKKLRGKYIRHTRCFEEGLETGYICWKNVRLLIARVNLWTTAWGVSVKF